MDRRLLLVLASLALATTASAQSEDPRFYLGAQVGVYLPSDSLIRDQLGESIITFGFGNVGDRRPSPGKFTPEINFLTADRNGSRLFAGSLSYGYEHQFSRQLQATTVPYARVFGGATYFDYAINTPSGRRDGRRVGLNYGAEVGLLFVNRLRLAARYNFFNEQDDLNFSGFVLSATVNLIGF
jgi:hypothetical protein